MENEQSIDHNNTIESRENGKQNCTEIFIIMSFQFSSPREVNFETIFTYMTFQLIR